MKHKTAHPSELLQKEEIDLICITETLLGGNDTVCLSVTPAAYVVLHHPCTTGQRGGMAIIFHESFYFCKLLAQPITGIDHKLHTLRTKDRSGILLVTRNLVMGDSAFMPRLPHSSPGLLTALVSPKWWLAQDMKQIIPWTYYSISLREALVLRLEICPERWSDHYLLKANENVGPTPCMKGAQLKWSTHGGSWILHSGGF